MEFNQIRTSSGASVYELIMIVTSSKSTVHAIKEIRTAGGMATFIQEKRVLYVKNTATQVVTKIGELLPGQTTLTDVPLSDGFYEIEVRSSQHFYEETRSRNRFTVNIVSGVIQSQGLPAIISLTSETTSAFSTKLTWTISDVTFIDGLTFGVWRSPTTPVVITGPPDFVVTGYKDSGKYKQLVTQTANEYFAVAAISGADKGPAKEILVPWDLTPPLPPYNTYGYNR